MREKREGVSVREGEIVGERERDIKHALRERAKERNSNSKVRIQKPVSKVYKGKYSKWMGRSQPWKLPLKRTKMRAKKAKVENIICRSNVRVFKLFSCAVY